MGSCNSTLIKSHEVSVFNILKSQKGFPFSELLKKEEILEALPRSQLSRKRVYNPEIVVWSFLSQAIEEDKSQQAAVLRVIAFFLEQGKRPPSGNTSAYSQARSRLPEECLSHLCKKVAHALMPPTNVSDYLWKGWRIKLVDGSTLSMPDTLENQQTYPQSPRQKKGLGFPSMRIVAVIDYMTGALLDLAAKAAYGGKETGEHALLRELMHQFDKNDLMIGDRYYPSFFLIATLLKEGISGVFPQHGSRHTDFRKGKSLGPKDHLIEWGKPKKKPEWMDQEEYDAFPEKIGVREVAIELKKPGFRSKKDILVTTFMDTKEVTRADLIQLYGHRWFAEISFYSIKETMKMGILRGKTPAMVRKEIWAHLLAYNLTRKIMWHNAQLSGYRVSELSFKLALQILRTFYQSTWSSSSCRDSLFHIVAYKQVANRPNRHEPRAVKRRPKRFPRLQKPREFYKNVALT
jgi:hypothetical protein